MRSVDFCYWVQGYFEIAGPNASLNKEQIEIIKKHLNMVFAFEIDPSFGEAQDKLNAIHNPETIHFNPIKPYKTPPLRPNDFKKYRC